MTYQSPPFAQTAPRAAGVSSGIGGGEGAGVSAGRLFRRVFDPWRKRAEFPELWARWCRENFRDSTQLGAAFGVSEKTARLWMQGVTSPSGWVVDAAKEGEIDGVPPFRAREAA